jgi:hypothetical protein
MAEAKAPGGAFLLLELESGLGVSRVAGIFHNVTLLPGVKSVADLSTIPMELLQERVLLRLDPTELQVWLKATKAPSGRKRAG